jgi:RNA polymerase sigma-70 factor (ECF subfamily)
VESDTLQVADPNRGRFRSFLLSSLKNFASNEWRDAQTLKRGGGLVQRSFNLDSGEHQYSQEPSHELTPERIFERRWAMLVLERALANLSDEFTASGKKELFEQLKFYLTGDPLSAHYREVAAKLGISEGAVKVAVHRLRRRYQECLRAEIAETVAESSQIDDELRALFTAVAS